jgi:hypothetical protein
MVYEKFTSGTPLSRHNRSTFEIWFHWQIFATIFNLQSIYSGEPPALGAFFSIPILAIRAPSVGGGSEAVVDPKAQQT